jgi:hypothetical protein
VDERRQLTLPCCLRHAANNYKLRIAAALAPCPSQASTCALQAPDRPVGLRNLGNTCYVNASLQMLHHISMFRDALLRLEPEVAGQKVVEQMRCAAPPPRGRLPAVGGQQAAAVAEGLAGGPGPQRLMVLRAWPRSCQAAGGSCNVPRAPTAGSFAAVPERPQPLTSLACTYVFAHLLPRASGTSSLHWSTAPAPAWTRQRLPRACSSTTHTSR